MYNLVAVFIIMLAPFSLSQAGLEERSAGKCAKVLADLAYRSQDYPDGGYSKSGQEVTIKWKGRSGFHRIRIATTNAPIESWKKERLQLGGASFDFANVGLNILKGDLPILNRAFAEAQQNHGRNNLKLEILGEKGAMETELTRLRELVLDKVFNAYFIRKGSYLRDIDLRQIRNINYLGQGFETFVVLSPLDGRVSTISGENFYNSILATIQITYQGEPSFWMPWHPKWAELNQNGKVLPFQYRMQPDTSWAFRAPLDAMLGNVRIAEITRYVRFSKIPKSVHAYMLAKTLDIAQRNNVEVLVISVDSLTKRLFERLYGFKLYDEIPTRYFQRKEELEDPPPEHHQREYLMYLDMRTDDFTRLHKLLRDQSSELNSETVPF